MDFTWYFNTALENFFSSDGAINYKGSVSEVEEGVVKGCGVSYVRACEHFADFRHTFRHRHYRL